MGEEGGRNEEERRVKLDWIDTPKGKVPTLDSTSEALSEVANYLNELYDRMDRVEAALGEGGSQKLDALLREVSELKASLEEVRRRLESIEALVEEVVGREDDMLYIVDLVEKMYRRLSGTYEGKGP